MEEKAEKDPAALASAAEPPVLRRTTRVRKQPEILDPSADDQRSIPHQNRKRKKEEGDLPDFFSILPSTVIQLVVNFQSHRDRLSLAAASTGLRNEVEVYSESALARIIEKHNVDETFDDRIRDQSSIVTTPSKPLKLPFRYLLWAGMRTHLYKLGERPSTNHVLFTPARMSPDGDRIALVEDASTGRNPLNLQIWDLATKQVVQNIEHAFGEREYATDLYFCGELIVTWSRDSLRVWDDTGHLTHRYRNEEIFLTTQHGEEIIFSTCNEEFDSMALHSFNVRSGTVRMNMVTDVTETGGVGIPDLTSITGRMLVCDKWLFVGLFMEHRGMPGSKSGIYVFDLDGFSKGQFFAGSYSRFTQSPQHAEEIFAHASHRDYIDVLNATNGHISRRFSFPVPAHSLVLAASHSYLYVRGPHGCVLVYNTENGDCERSLDCPRASGARGSISKARGEVFFRLDFRAGRPRPTAEVAAYCLTDAL